MIHQVVFVIVDVDESRCVVDTDLMRTPKHAIAAAAVVGTILATAVGCSTATDPVGPVLFRQVDAAENVMYRVLVSSEERGANSEELFAQLSETLDHWDGEADPPDFPEDIGTAVFYNHHEDAHGEQASFEMFVASGLNDTTSTQDWFRAAPTRVYTCYRIDLSFESGALTNRYRGSDYDEHRLECPTELVRALGDGASYRDPWVFDG